MPPLATGADEVEEPVQQGPRVCRARLPAGLCRQDQRRKQPELLIRQRLPGTEIT